MKHFSLFCTLLLITFIFGCGDSDNPDVKKKQKTVGVAFETLQTEYWNVSFEAIRKELKGKNIKMIEAIADGDANRQLEQVKNFIAMGVDGIICAPKDARTVIPMIKAANRAGIPFVSYNRPPAESSAKAVTVVADNFSIARDTVKFMCETARKQGGKYKAMILIGDLGDINAVNRRDGFFEAIKDYKDIIEVVSKVTTEWKQEKALAGVTNGLQANPDINFLFTSSDFLFPSIISALKAKGKYKKIGEEGHVIMGGFDGDATAYKMLKEGYLDADGVQDIYFECEQSVMAIVAQWEGKKVESTIPDPGFVIHQGNLEKSKAKMWGSHVYESNLKSQASN